MSESEPPGPGGLPVLGNTHQFARDSTGFFEWAAEFGDVVAVSLLGLGDAYLLTDAADVESVLASNDEQFIKPNSTREALGDMLGNGLVLSEGEFWTRQRRLMQPGFHPDRVAGYAETMAGEARRLGDEWAAGETVDVEEEMVRVTVRILSKVLFGPDVDQDELGIWEAVEALQGSGHPVEQLILPRLLPDFLLRPLQRHISGAVEQFETIIMEEIAARRRSPGEYDDLLSTVMASEDAEGDGMTDEQLRDEMMTLLFAGHETTSIALTGTWYLLARNPDARDRLHAELDEVLDGRPPTMADLPDLEYTANVVTEAMRLYPPVPVLAREPVADVEVGGYTIPEGSVVMAPQWVVHRDPAHYPEPGEYRPGRWTDEFEAELPNYAYFPFGGGPRRCIGGRFAEVEARLIVATLAQRYELESAMDEPLHVEGAIQLTPMNDVEMTVRER